MTTSTVIIHITGNGHKVHHAIAQDGYSVRSACGSERFGTYRNGIETTNAISCGKCSKGAWSRCSICHPA